MRVRRSMINPNGIIENGVFSITPTRNNLKWVKAFKGEGAKGVIVSKQPTDATVEGILSNIFKKTEEFFIHDVVEEIGITVIIGSDG